MGLEKPTEEVTEKCNPLSLLTPLQQGKKYTKTKFNSILSNCGCC